MNGECIFFLCNNNTARGSLKTFISVEIPLMKGYFKMFLKFPYERRGPCLCDLETGTLPFKILDFQWHHFPPSSLNAIGILALVWIWEVLVIRQCLDCCGRKNRGFRSVQKHLQAKETGCSLDKKQTIKLGADYL